MRDTLPRFMRRLKAIFLFLLLSGSSLFAANDWTLVKYGGRDHVTLDNVREFYGLEQISRAHNHFTLGTGMRSLRGAVGSNEIYINNLKFILSYPVSENDGQPIISRMDLTKVIEPVLRPSRIKGADQVTTIVLDPGHGGHDNGATNFWGNEKNYSLDVAFRTRALLEKRGFMVKMTRTDDTFVPLEDRVRFANRFANALFISIHFNSGSSAASGLETYTLAPRGVPSMAADGPRLSDLHLCAGNINDAENMALATATHASLVCKSQLYDRGIKRARFVVIRDITIPGVLIEGGFLSNSTDSRKVMTTQYRQNMASCIATAVSQYRAAVGGGAPGELLAEKSVMLRNDTAGDGTPTVQLRATEPAVVITPAQN